MFSHLSNGWYRQLLLQVVRESCCPAEGEKNSKGGEARVTGLQVGDMARESWVKKDEKEN